MFSSFCDEMVWEEQQASDANVDIQITRVFEYCSMC